MQQDKLLYNLLNRTYVLNIRTNKLNNTVLINKLKYNKLHTNLKNTIRLYNPFKALKTNNHKKEYISISIQLKSLFSGLNGRYKAIMYLIKIKIKLIRLEILLTTSLISSKNKKFYREILRKNNFIEIIFKINVDNKDFLKRIIGKTMVKFI